MDNRETIHQIADGKLPGREALAGLLSTFDRSDLDYAGQLAARRTEEVFGRNVYIRGLIEFTNHCKNDCLYCGIRRSNRGLTRYRLTGEEILSCCGRGYALGYRTFVLQGGEDLFYTDDRVCHLVSAVKKQFSDCAVTLSLGERSREAYRRFYDAGADRYLLRHETISGAHYARLHPAEMSWERRMDCLYALKEIGYQTGCGFMVGSPGQTAENLADELRFLMEFRPQMVGIGPFLPHRDTPFGQERPGSVEQTLLLLSLIRLLLPGVLLPATTALGTAERDGRLRGIRAGANVIMPNLSPLQNRKDYALYDNKTGLGEDAAEQIDAITAALSGAGYRVLVSRGDYREHSAQ